MNTDDHKATLEKANAAVTAGNHELFLSFFTDDTEWNFLGDQVLKGKEAVRVYISKAYTEPPRFNTESLIAEGPYLTAIGRISLKEDGQWKQYHYCDVWQFRDGLMDKLRAFVIPG